MALNLEFRCVIPIRFNWSIEFDVLIWFQSIYAFEDCPNAINSESHRLHLRSRYTFTFNVSSHLNAGPIHCTANFAVANSFEPLRTLLLVVFFSLCKFHCIRFAPQLTFDSIDFILLWHQSTALNFVNARCRSSGCVRRTCQWRRDQFIICQKLNEN